MNVGDNKVGEGEERREGGNMMCENNRIDIV
jgi:hypothetical protein